MPTTPIPAPGPHAACAADLWNPDLTVECPDAEGRRATGRLALGPLPEGEMRERVFRFLPGFDARPDPYGQHGGDLLFVIRGREGAVALRVFPHWTPPQHPDPRYLAIEPIPLRPIPASLSVHRRPSAEEHESGRGRCGFLGGLPCDVTEHSLAAETPWAVFVCRGSEACFEWLEAYYREVFRGADTEDPDDEP